MALWPRIKLHHRKKKRKENETSPNSSRSCNTTTTEGLSPIQQIVGCFLLLDTSCNLQWRKSWLSCRDHHETKLLLCRSFHDRFPNMSDHVTTKQQIGTGISKWRLYPWWLQEVVATCWAQSLSQTEMAKLHGDPLCMRRAMEPQILVVSGYIFPWMLLKHVETIQFWGEILTHTWWPWRSWAANFDHTMHLKGTFGP